MNSIPAKQRDILKTNLQTPGRQAQHADTVWLYQPQKPHGFFSVAAERTPNPNVLWEYQAGRRVTYHNLYGGRKGCDPSGQALIWDPRHQA